MKSIRSLEILISLLILENISYSIFTTFGKKLHFPMKGL